LNAKKSILNVTTYNCNSIDGVTDPFCYEFLDDTPGENSIGGNLTNEINVVHFSPSSPPNFYFYTRNYSPSAWSCHDCDGDGILNSFEDSNGNGYYDEGDISNLCDPCDPFHPFGLEVNSIDGSKIYCAGDSINLNLNILGGWLPFDVYFGTNQYNTTQYNNYYNGDTIILLPNNGETLIDFMITDSFGCYLDTSISLFPIQGPIEVLSQPKDYFYCSNFFAFFSIDAINHGQGELFYNWQMSTDGGTSFVDLNSSPPFSTVFSDSLNISNLNGLDEKYFRCKLWTQACDTVYSDWAKLKKIVATEFTNTLEDVTTCNGSSSILVACAEGQQEAFYFSWEYSTNGGQSWDALQMSGIYSHSFNDTALFSGCDTLFLAETEGLDGFLFRAVINTALCGTIFSTSAEVKAIEPLYVIEQPANISTCSLEDTVSLEVVLSKDNSDGAIIYQWEMSCDMSQWENVENNAALGIAGANSLALKISNLEGLDGCSFRLAYKHDFCEWQHSGIAQIFYANPVNILAQPANISICTGESASFNVQASNITMVLLEYQWQILDAAGEWKNITNNPVFSGSTAATLHVNEPDELDSTALRCLVGAPNCNWIASSAALLFIEDSIEFASQPVSAYVCPAIGHVFEAALTTDTFNSNLNFQWQQSLAGTLDWKNIAENSPTGFGGLFTGTTTTHLYITKTEGLSGTQFRLKVSGNNCEGFSNEVTLTEDTTSNCGELTCLKAKIQFLRNENAWAVFVKANNLAFPSTNCQLMSGRLTIVAREDFTLSDFTSQSGDWQPTSYTYSPINNPGAQYFTFELNPGNYPISFNANNEARLFSFKKVGACPDSMYIMVNNFPDSILENTIAIEYPNPAAISAFQFCGVYDKRAWKCRRIFPSFPSVSFPVTDSLSWSGEETYGLSEQTINKERAEATMPKKTDGYNQKIMIISPNPASDKIFVTAIFPNSGHNSVLILRNMQGSLLKKLPIIDSDTLEISLKDIPAGLYIFEFVKNGQVLQREKVIVL
jgi:hypothetical protein